jgi:ribonucleoside-diphosphate reductase subunit M1
MAFVNKESAPNGASDGVPTPSTTPPPIKTAVAGDAKARVLNSPSKPPAFKADVDEGDSPKALPTEPVEKPSFGEIGSPVLDAKKEGQSEDKEEDSKERELDIYSEAVLACKSQYHRHAVHETRMLTKTPNRQH